MFPVFCKTHSLGRNKGTVFLNFENQSSACCHLQNQFSRKHNVVKNKSQKTKVFCSVFLKAILTVVTNINCSAQLKAGSGSGVMMAPRLQMF